MYGDWATQNHEGAAFVGGQVTGIAVSFALGYGSAGQTANLARGAWALRTAQLYTSAGTAYGIGHSSYNVATGQATAWDALSFVPAAGRGGRVFGRLRTANGGGFGVFGPFTRKNVFATNKSDRDALAQVLRRTISIARSNRFQVGAGLAEDDAAKQIFFVLLRVANKGISKRGGIGGIIKIRNRLKGTTDTALGLALGKNALEFTIRHELAHFAREALALAHGKASPFLREYRLMKNPLHPIDPRYWMLFFREESAAWRITRATK